MRTIPLSNRDFPVLVSDEDYDWLSRFSWFAKKSRHGWYACTNVRVKSRVITFRLHRLIMLCFSDEVVDHADFNHWNNQRTNLSIMDNVENARKNKPEYTDVVPF